MVPDGPAHLFVDIRLEELGAPVAVIAPDESGDGDVVKQAGETTFSLVPFFWASRADWSMCAEGPKR
jgi:hypothetical protein